MKIHKRMARTLIWKTFGRVVSNAEAIPVLAGPLRGKHLPKVSALANPTMLLGLYEPAVVQELLRSSAQAHIAYDIGAHVGFMTLVLARSLAKVGHVFAFEPVPANVALLEELVTLNDLGDVVSVLPLALGNTTGAQEMVMWGSSSMHLLQAAVADQDISHCPSITVQSSTLDSFVFEQNNPLPHLIKIDVEGAEVKVLEGALRTLRTSSPRVLVEIHGPHNAQGVWQITQALGYSWTKVSQGGNLPVYAERELLGFFRKDSWTHHFLLVRKEEGCHTDRRQPKAQD